MVESWACNWKNVGLIMAGSVVSMNLEQLKYGGGGTWPCKAAYDVSVVKHGCAKSSG